MATFIFFELSYVAAVCFWRPYEPASNHNSVQQMPYTVRRGDDEDIGRPATRASVVLPVQMQGFLKDCNFRQIVNHRSAGNPANIAERYSRCLS
jgi:hypothetical protein